MSQKSGEKVDHFVSRLRQKAATCEFGNVEDAIRDQLLEKCSDSKLRRKFLERVNASLKDLQDIARAYEAVEEQWTIPLLDKLLDSENQLAQLERASYI